MTEAQRQLIRARLNDVADITKPIAWRWAETFGLSHSSEAVAEIQGMIAEVKAEREVGNG